MELRKRFINSMYSIAAEPGDTPDLKNWKILFVGAMLFSTPMLLVWAVVYLSLDEAVVSAILASFAIVILSTFLLLHFRQIQFHHATNIMLGTNVTVGFLSTLAIGGR